jgi:hypothetical protein
MNNAGARNPVGRAGRIGRRGRSERADGKWWLFENSKSVNVVLGEVGIWAELPGSKTSLALRVGQKDR